MHLRVESNCLRKLTSSPRVMLRKSLIAESLGEDKEVLIELLDSLRLWFRDILIFKETNQPTYLINKDLKDEVNKSASLLSCSDIFEKVNILTDVQLALHGNVNPRLAMESMLLQLCQ